MKYCAIFKKNYFALLSLMLFTVAQSSQKLRKPAIKVVKQTEAVKKNPEQVLMERAAHFRKVQSQVVQFETELAKLSKQSASMNLAAGIRYSIMVNIEQARNVLNAANAVNFQDIKVKKLKDSIDKVINQVAKQVLPKDTAANAQKLLEQAKNLAGMIAADFERKARQSSDVIDVDISQLKRAHESPLFSREEQLESLAQKIGQKEAEEDEKELLKKLLERKEQIVQMFGLLLEDCDHEVLQALNNMPKTTKTEDFKNFGIVDHSLLECEGRIGLLDKLVDAIIKIKPKLDQYYIDSLERNRELIIKIDQNVFKLFTKAKKLIAGYKNLLPLNKSLNYASAPIENMHYNMTTVVNSFIEKWQNLLRGFIKASIIKQAHFYK